MNVRILRYILLILVMGGIALLFWALFGWETERIYQGELMFKRTFGRITKTCWRYDTDASWQGCQYYSWESPLIRTASNDPPPGAHLWMDLNRDGSPDYWESDDPNAENINHIQIDTNRDGEPDRSVSCGQYLRDRLIFTLATGNRARDYSIEAPEPWNPMAAMVIYPLSLELKRDFWKRAVSLQIDDGIERDIAEQLAAGLLPEARRSWPIEIHDFFDALRSEVGSDEVALYQTEVHYWESVWQGMVPRMCVRAVSSTTDD